MSARIFLMPKVATSAIIQPMHMALEVARLGTAAHQCFAHSEIKYELVEKLSVNEDGSNNFRRMDGFTFSHMPGAPMPDEPATVA